MKRAFLLFFAALLLLSIPTSCPASEKETQAFAHPPQLNDGWQVSTPAAEDMDETQIMEISADIASGRYQGIHTYLVIKNGALVHEAYFGDYDRDSLQVIFSITKSVTSTLVGIAIERGEIPGLQTPLPELLPEYAGDIADPRARTVNLEHLLTLHSGFEWDEQTYSYSDIRNTERQMVNSPHWVKFFLGLPMRGDPGAHYQYNTGSVHLISAILHSRTGLFADEYLREHLLGPLGIEHFEWNRDPQGYPCTGGTHGGLWMRPRDLAKFAYLFLNGGRWQGLQVVPEDWVALATTPKADAPPPTDIGYLWWMGHYEIGGRRLRYFYGAGYGGQTISFVPELDLLVVFTCWSRSQDCEFFAPLFRTIKAASPVEHLPVSEVSAEEDVPEPALPEPPLFVPSPGATPGETFDLSYRLDKGSEFSIRSVERIERNLTVQGDEVAVHLENAADYRARVTAEESDGMDLELSYRGHTYSSDLRQGQDTADFSALIGKTIRARLSQSGKWSDFRGLDLLPEIPLPGEKVPWGEERFLSEVRSTFPFLPGTMVEAGESWTDQYTHMELLVGEIWVPVTVNYAYTLLDRSTVKGKDCVKIAANLTIHAAAQFVDGGIDWDIRFEGSGQGSYLFDLKQGVLLTSEEGFEYTGRADSEEIGQVIPFQVKVHRSVGVDF